MKEILKDTFNLIYLHVYGVEYNFRNKNVEKEIDSFLGKMPDGAGEEWMYEYIVFQFAHYNGMKTRFNRVYLNWIFGDKALQRWRERTEDQSYHANQYKLSLGVKKDSPRLSISEYNNAERMRFTDMSRQLLHCHENSLFSVGNDICKVCPMYKTCILKKD